MVNDNRLISLLKINCHGVSRLIRTCWHKSISTILSVILLTVFSFDCLSKVEKPNYKFTLKKFDDFLPGTDINQVKKKFGEGVLVKKEDKITVLRFLINHVRYKFPITVQVDGNRITDFTAALPSYFLHNVFHQSLINKYGKQDQYHAHAGQGVYIWNKKSNNVIIYEGGCSITCHPISFNMKKKNLGKITSLFDQLNKPKKN